MFSQEREITHMQYIDWPDHGIPENPQPFLSECIWSRYTIKKVIMSCIGEIPPYLYIYYTALASVLLLYAYSAV